ncbi:hypothetical protein B0O80DRAFT_491693 [Mortierella sp. GBAus27b]|nr:hypothetical protein B0O80DRAFT_491693 [Mortierella sp. GBAus27b]
MHQPPLALDVVSFAQYARIRDTQEHLRSLGWRDRSSNPLRQVWDPLYTCARQTNLSTLRIQHTRFYEQDLEPFWTICRQLEILELTDVRFTVLPDLLDESSPGMEPAPHATATAVTTTDAAAAVRFPRLRELTLEALQMAPSKQMKHFVLQCPLIHTLVWRPTSYEFLMGDFCDYFAANRWPHLDSLEISGQFNFISAEEYDRFLQSTSQLFRCLDLQTKTMEQGSFDLLRKGGHFKTLTKVDLSVWPPSRDEVNGVDVAASKRIREVLESCPSLEHIVGTSISGRDIIDSQPWVCHRLKMFAMLICMDITKQTPRAKAEYTEHDKRQCHQVLERLGQMKQLEVLNMSNYDLMIAPLRPPVILPLDLRMGLEHLSTLRDLEWLGVDGTLNMRLVDVEWMLQHWTKLRKMTGKPFTVRDSWFLRDNNVQVYLIMKALAARKVEVPEQWKAYEKQVKKHG